MKLSIITPCSRPFNLPIIYSSILSMNTDDVEWLIVYDSDKIDERILQYEKNVKIRLFNRKREKDDSYASMLRNIGIENAKGEYLYFLDDDNLVHYRLYEKICSYGDVNTLLIFNQFSESKKRRIKKFNLEYIKPGYIDTAQIVVPRKYKSRWDNSVYYIDEYPYLKKLINEVDKKYIKWVDRIYTYRNYLRRFDIK